ncbi:MAG: hypothetical protein N2037_13760, partial [Acidimicrobiales bacterium]|nr:hypothetical protein [Acidimicrobiales bacterium]
RYPGLALAWQCLRAPAGTTVVLNAANEVAVAAFLDGRLGFRDIHAVNEAVLALVPASRPQNLPEILDLDASARRKAEAEVIRRVR